MEGKSEQKNITPTTEKKINWLVYFFLFFFAIFKDFIEIIIGLIPLAGPFLALVVGLPFAALILTILFLYGKLGLWQWIGVAITKILDFVSLVLPITTLMVLGLFLLEKSDLKKAVILLEKTKLTKISKN